MLVWGIWNWGNHLLLCRVANLKELKSQDIEMLLGYNIPSPGSKKVLLSSKEGVIFMDCIAHKSPEDADDYAQYLQLGNRFLKQQQGYQNDNRRHRCLYHGPVNGRGRVHSGVEHRIKKGYPQNRQYTHDLPGFNDPGPVLPGTAPGEGQQNYKGNRPAPESKADRGNDVRHAAGQDNVAAPAQRGRYSQQIRQAAPISPAFFMGILRHKH